MAHLLLAKHYFQTEGSSAKSFRDMMCSVNRMCGATVKNQYLLLKDVAKPISSRTFSEIKKLTSLSMTGENNPYYGKKHSPEILSKIQQNRGPTSEQGMKNIRAAARLQGLKHKGLLVVFNSLNGSCKRIYPDQLQAYLASGYIRGHDPKTNEARALKRKGIPITWDIPRGREHNAWGTIHMFHANTKHSIRVKAESVLEALSLGYIKGQFKSEQALQNIRMGSSLAHKGVAKPYMQEVNRRPDKIKKAAENIKV